VHVTADGRLVAFHDEDLARTTGRSGLIKDLPWSEVRAALVGGVEPIPLLEEVLASFPEARVNIDCKSDQAVEPLVAVLRSTGSLDRVCLGAFSSRRLRRLRAELGPEVCTSMGPTEVARWLVSGLVPSRRFVPSVPCIQVPVSQFGVPVVTAASLARAHRLGMDVHVWTIDDESEMERLLDLGVDGIMTDRPAVLKDVLVRRGLWS
jgi:glycerophosphoryl diester phosphodiesterase